ncbi:MAG TPA: tripartite tricarboxylate transporter substrate binding protein [Devosia sp.]|nr:tripartite tricarboxylate transporter substrate binding protein [Devosia sp.]
MKLNRREFIVLGGATTLLATTGISMADDWPSKSVTVISAYPPGGSADAVTRFVAEALTNVFGQQFVTQNVAGAAGSLAAGQVARSAPDGYTFFVTGSAPLGVNKIVQKNLAYDPLVDLTPISILGETALILSASPTAPAKTLKEFIDYARANSGMVNVGNPGAGTKGHIVAATIGHLTGVELNHIPYKGTGPLLPDLLGGHIDFALDTTTSYIPHILDGKLNGVAISSAARSEKLPDVLTVAESGVAELKDYHDAGWFAAAGPKGMDPAVVTKLSTAINEWLVTPEARAKLDSIGMTPVAGTPEQLFKAMQVEIANIIPLVEAGLVNPT